MASFPEEIPGDDLIRAFTLTGADRDLVAIRRGAANRLGLALQLCALRYLGFVPRNLSAAPRSAACFVADQLERDWISDRNPSTTWFPTADQKEAFTNVSAARATNAQACIDLASIWGELAEQALVLAESWTEFADKGVSGTG